MSTPTETDMILMDQKEISCCEQEGEKDDTQMTCDALCSLGSTRPGERCESPTESNECTSEGRKAGKTCPKQLQLPMFLSSKLTCLWTMMMLMVPYGRTRFP